MRLVRRNPAGQGYDALCESLKEKKSGKAILALATPGGDPDAGFRIARALQHGYGSFTALVPRYCKSAGTMIILGASELYMANVSELGPLDIQIKKGDELDGRNSGLDIFEAVSFLQNQTMATFREQLRVLTNQGLSTKVASDIATRLTRGIFEPIASQIDPMKLAEFQRANNITMAYGWSLAEVGKNLLSSTSLDNLVGGYPSHGFVIDRKEARKSFRVVKEPVGEWLRICENINKKTLTLIGSSVPRIFTETVEIEIGGEDDGANNKTRANGFGSSTLSESKVIGVNGPANTSQKNSGIGADSASAARGRQKKGKRKSAES